MKLETKRLILRKPKKIDWKDLLEGLNDKTVTTYLCGVNYPYKKNDAEELIKESIKNWNRKKIERYQFFIVLKYENKVIGGINLHEVDLFDKTAGITTWVNKKYQRFGYMLESRIKINEFAFDQLKLRKLKSDVVVSNIPSNNLLKKLGYKKEGFLRKDIRSKATGKIYDTYIYGLFKEDWEKIRPKLIKELNGRN